MGEIGRLSFIRHLEIPKRSGISQFNSNIKRFICDDLATLCKNLVNFSPVTPEFKRQTCTPPCRSAVWLRGATARLARISAEFSDPINTQFTFTYTLEGVIAMPRGLHARFCHAFLVTS